MHPRRNICRSANMAGFSSLPARQNTILRVASSLMKYLLLASIMICARISAKAVTVTSVTLNPTIVYGGTYTTATIKFSGALPAGSGAFYLSSNNAIASVPTSIGGATGDTQETFIVDVAPLTTGSSQSPIITVTYAGVPTSATLTVLVDTTTSFFLTPTADAFVQAGTSHAANFGGLTTLVVKTDSTPPSAGTRVTYLKFDLTGVTSSPARAFLKLYFSSAPNVADRAYAVNVYSLPATLPGWRRASPGTLPRTSIRPTPRISMERCWISPPFCSSLG